MQNIQKSVTISIEGGILLFPVIYFLFVTAKCLSYRGSWSLSHKRHTNGHMYYYKQIGNKTCYVRRRDESQVLAEYKERQKWRQERKELNQQLMNLSPSERREARQQMKSLDSRNYPWIRI